MQTHRQDPMKSTATRLDQIAVMHREHARELERRVARRARAEPQTIEDACSFAWMQLITHSSIDLDEPSYRTLAWITRTAIHEAWRLEARRARDELLDEAALRRELCQRGQTTRGVDQLAAERARLDLVAQIAPRPRRFLLRQALGHSYQEIAADETVSVTTTAKQIARAKRLLRALEAAEATPAPSPGCTSVGRPLTPAAGGVSA